MLLIELVKWWYSAGIVVHLRKIARRLQRTQDNFSLGLLLKTLFKPFRQIDAAANLDPTVSVSIDQQFKRFTSDLISRFIGFWMRLFLMLAGIAILILQTLYSVLTFAIYLVLPLAPIAGIVLAILGKVPPDVGV
jgi:hypothetical protein